MDANNPKEFADGSKVTVATLMLPQIRNLTLLCKVWGFLKYHHPGVTSGKWNWDHELFRVLPRILAAKDAVTGNTALLAWCRQIGAAPKQASNIRDNGEIHIRLTLDWIRDENRLGKDLCAWLRAVYKNRHSKGGQHYISHISEAGNPSFKNEANYSHFAFPDVGYRILALFRFWNIVEYWSPYRDVIGEDWDGVLEEFLPHLVSASNEDAYKLELMTLIARVNDSHSNLWSSLDVQPPRGKSSLPIDIRFIEGKAVVVSTKQKELAIGDIILAIDGRSIDDLIHAWSPYYAASNQAARLRDIARNLTRGTGSCRVWTMRNDTEKEHTLERTLPVALEPSLLYHDRSGETFQILSPNVGYLKLSSVKQVEIDSYIRQARGTKGLVIDIRNYPSEFVVFSLGSRFILKPTQFTRITTGDLANPGTFRWEKPFAMHPQEPGYKGRIVILVDESTQSQAEYTAMAFRAAPGGVVVGSTTAGADGDVSSIPLPGGLRTMISGVGIFHSDKTPTQRIGIIPDVKICPTLDGIRAGRDEVLEEGIRQILKKGAFE